MKKGMLTAVIMVIAAVVTAQEFPVAWKTKFSFKPDRWFYDDDARYVLGRTDEEAEVLDGATGKSLWKLNFRSDLQIKSLSRATYNAAEGVVLFFNPDEKKKTGEKVIVDLATGKMLWRGDQYQGTDADDNYHFANSISSLTAKQTTIVFNDITKKFVGLDLKSGNVKWESKAYPDVSLEKNVGINSIDNSEFAQVFIYDEDILKTQVIYISIVTGEVLSDDSRFTSASGEFNRSSSGKIKSRRILNNTTIDLTGTMKELGFKITFELKASGDVNWSKSWEGSAVRQIIGDAPYVKLDIQGDKIFVISKAITVFDIKTGNQLWSAPFDNCDASVGLKAKQEFGIAGWPLVAGNVIYYVDLQNDNAIKKVDGNSGNLLWKSEKLKSNDRVPNLLMVNGILIAQFGGMINTQTYIPDPNGGSGRYKNENRFDGNFEVRAYDPTNGKMIWSTAALAGKLGDKFSDRISTIYPLNNKIVVSSADNLFCLDPKTGESIYKTSIADAKIGSMVEMTVSEDFQTLFIYCDNGVASADVATGKLNYATKTGAIFWKESPSSSYKFYQGNNLFIWVGESDFVGFDLAKGLLKGKMEDNIDPQMTADGNSILLRDGDKVTRFAVNQ